MKKKWKRRILVLIKTSYYLHYLLCIISRLLPPFVLISFIAHINRVAVWGVCVLFRIFTVNISFNHTNAYAYVIQTQDGFSLFSSPWDTVTNVIQQSSRGIAIHLFCQRFRLNTISFCVLKKFLMIARVITIRLAVELHPFVTQERIVQNPIDSNWNGAAFQYVRRRMHSN